jgi:hypothetical protein
MVRKNSLPFITGPRGTLSGIYIPYFALFYGKVFCGKLAELPHTSTCFISCWEKERQAEVKEIRIVISIVV